MITQEHRDDEIGKLVVKLLGEDRFNATPGKYRALARAIEAAAIERCAKLMEQRATEERYEDSEVYASAARELRALLPKEE